MSLSAALSPTSGSGILLLSSVVAVALVYQAWKAIYNVFFHPLAAFPGPWWASASYLHEMYFDVWLNGRYFKRMEEMHQQYGRMGPIIRMNPSELHINDPEFFDEVYAGSARRRNKDPSQEGVAAVPSSMIGTLDHDLHRRRRNILSNFFSKQAISRLEDVLQEKVDKLVARMKDSYVKGKVLELHHVFSSLTSDMISHYAYGKSFGYLDDENFKGENHQAVVELMKHFHVGRLFPFIEKTLALLPPWLLRYSSSAIGDVTDLKLLFADLGAKAVRDRGLKSAGQDTVFEALTRPEIPASERHAERVADESLLVLLAGTETTSRTLVTIMFYLLDDMSIMERLRQELEGVMPTPETSPSWRQLEQLPYLTAVINEGLRMNNLIMRSPRIAPDEALVYRDWVIPPGTTMSMTLMLLDYNADLYPDPYHFRPERWIEAADEGRRLRNFAFSGGSRICLGVNLAWLELYLVTATLVRRFDFETLNASRETFMAYRDWVAGVREDGYFGLKVKVASILQD